jgi:hypothetical protein
MKKIGTITLFDQDMAKICKQTSNPSASVGTSTSVGYKPVRRL